MYFKSLILSSCLLILIHLLDLIFIILRIVLYLIVGGKALHFANLSLAFVSATFKDSTIALCLSKEVSSLVVASLAFASWTWFCNSYVFKLDMLDFRCQT